MSSQKRVIELTLGFAPREFYDDLSSAIDKHITDGITSFTTELQKIAAAKGYNDITEDILAKSSKALEDIIRDRYKKNVNKFCTYSDRNVFTIPEKTKPTEVEQDYNLQPEAQLEQLSAEASSLRNQYIQLLSELDALTCESRDGEALLKDLDEALFQIRLTSQALATLQPLGETLAGVADQTAKLEELSNRAYELTAQLQPHCERLGVSAASMATSSSSRRGIDEEADITTGGLSDIVALNRAIARP